MTSKTFIMLKPDALERQLVDLIMERFFKAGFQVDKIHYTIVEESIIKKHYAEVLERFGDPYLKYLHDNFVGKPVIPLVLSHSSENAIPLARKLLGATRPEMAEPGTIRGDYGIGNTDPKTFSMNLVHASDSPTNYEYEKKLWLRP